MPAGRLFTLLALMLAVVASSIAVVYSKYQSRRLFVELQGLRAERDNIDIEWGRLQIELQTWADDSRVDRLARKDLGMALPKAEDTVLIGPGE